MKLLPWFNIAIAWIILILAFRSPALKGQRRLLWLAAFLWCGVTALYLSRLIGDR